MDDDRFLRRDLDKLTDKVTKLGQDLKAVAGRTQRFALDLSPLAAGVTSVPVAWPAPFPDLSYSVQLNVQHAAVNLGQVFWTVQGGSRTVDGCTVLVRNTSGATISAGLDVLAVRA